MNNATIYGTAAVDANSDFDVLTRKDYVDGAIVDGINAELRNADGYQWRVSGVANAIGFQKLSNSTFPFLLQTDLTNTSLMTV
jgi:hypothetical protein